ncbi:MAG: ABC transporter substrate-binding protein, partial [Candidatus Binatia bacterium]
AYTAMSILPAGMPSSARNWREGCAGTGAFRITSFEPGRSLKLEANPDYWRPGLPKSAAIEFVFDCSPQEILAGFRSGKFSMAWDLLPSDVDRLRHEGESGVRFYEIPILSTDYLALNVHREPFSDLKLRQKFFDAIDVDGLVRRYLARLAVPGHTLIPPGLLDSERAPRRRPAPAARHTGERIPVKVMFHSVYEAQYGGFIQELLRSLDENGFDVDVIDRKGEYRKISGVPDADVTITRWLADYPDADSFMNSVLHTERGGEGPFCGSPDLDALIEQGRTESEPSTRQAIYRQIEELIRKRALILPLFYEQAYCFTRPKVEGLELNFFNPYVPYEYLWIRGSS